MDITIDVEQQQQLLFLDNMGQKIERARARGQDRKNAKPKTITKRDQVITKTDRPLNPAEQFTLNLLKGEREGRFDLLDVHPESEYPSVLMRLPIFVPATRCNQRKLLDDQNAIPFETPSGKGRKHGPPLTVFDEDTLIALGRLRNKRLKGNAHLLPLPLALVTSGGDGEKVVVDGVVCTIGDIQDELGVSQGGKNDKLRLESLRRLSNIVISFDKQSKGKLIKSQYSSFKLLELQDITVEGGTTTLYVQFHPQLTHWFNKEFSYINWDLRKKLKGKLTKALHRYISCKHAGTEYTVRSETLMDILGYLRPHNKFLDDLRKAITELRDDHGWLDKSTRIEGRNKKTGILFIFKRAKK